MSFVELVRYLSSLPSVKCEKLAFLSQSNAKIPLSIFLAHGDNMEEPVTIQMCWNFITTLGHEELLTHFVGQFIQATKGVYP